MKSEAKDWVSNQSCPAWRNGWVGNTLDKQEWSNRQACLQSGVEAPMGARAQCFHLGSNEPHDQSWAPISEFTMLMLGLPTFKVNSKWSSNRPQIKAKWPTLKHPNLNAPYLEARGDLEFEGRVLTPPSNSRFRKLLKSATWQILGLYPSSTLAKDSHLSSIWIWKFKLAFWEVTQLQTFIALLGDFP
jgi:hypothetical protein